MQEFLSTLLQAVAAVAVPAVSAFAIRFLNELTAQAAAKRYIAVILDAIKTSVMYVSQDFVDAHKKSGTFDAECQKEAFNRAAIMATSLLTADAARFLAETYGDMGKFIQAKIEAQVKLQKV